ncbi:hypothetical protein ACWGLB_04310 [Streptomyces sp. NPDC055893]
MTVMVRGGEQEPEDGAGDAGGGLGQAFLAFVGAFVVGGDQHAEDGLAREIAEGGAEVGRPDAGGG